MKDEISPCVCTEYMFICHPKIDRNQIIADVEKILDTYNPNCSFNCINSLKEEIKNLKDNSQGGLNKDSKRGLPSSDTPDTLRGKEVGKK